MGIKTLYAKISIILIILLSVCLLLFYATILYNYELYQSHATQHVNRNLAANILKDNKARAGDITHKPIWKKYLESAMIANPGIDLYLLNSNGKITNYAVHPELVVREDVSIKPIKEFLKQGSILPLYGDNPKSLDKKILFSVAPMLKAGQLQGYLYIVLTASTPGLVTETGASGVNGHQSFVLKNMFISVSLIIVFILLSGLTIVKRITRKIQSLSSDMSDFQNSGFTKIPDKFSSRSKVTDEVDVLHQLFRKLSGITANYIHKLEEKDDLRRELVAQVCHDIKSPLATLNGYIDLLLNDRAGLKKEYLDQFLHNSSRQGQKINHMIEDLLFLSNLEDIGYRLSCEIVNVSELVSDIVQQFQVVSYRDTGVAINYHAPDYPVKASLDVGMFDRVVSNLIGNALKHSCSKGVIEVSVSKIDDNCIVSVKDYGKGVAPEERDRIFDRLYRTKNSIEEGISGSGLGLSICKKIVDLHNGRLTIEPNSQSGARFTIILKAS